MEPVSLPSGSSVAYFLSTVARTFPLLISSLNAWHFSTVQSVLGCVLLPQKMVSLFQPLVSLPLLSYLYILSQLHMTAIQCFIAWDLPKLIQRKNPSLFCNAYDNPPSFSEVNDSLKSYGQVKPVSLWCCDFCEID